MKRATWYPISNPHVPALCHSSDQCLMVDDCSHPHETWFAAHPSLKHSGGLRYRSICCCGLSGPSKPHFTATSDPFANRILLIPTFLADHSSVYTQVGPGVGAFGYTQQQGVIIPPKSSTSTNAPMLYVPHVMYSTRSDPCLSLLSRRLPLDSRSGAWMRSKGDLSGHPKDDHIRVFRAANEPNSRER